MVSKKKAPETDGLRRPTKEEVALSVDKLVKDVIAPDLDILFCGINPGLYSAATGHHFARPGNRFWKALYESKITNEVLSPAADRHLLDFGVGITNLVARATVAASELSAQELKDGAKRLEAKVRRHRPRVLAVLGLQAFSTGFGEKAVLGRQEMTIAGTPIFVLANPSGLQARYQLPELTVMFAEVKLVASQLRASSAS